jgi:hypothetical protein
MMRVLVILMLVFYSRAQDFIFGDDTILNSSFILSQLNVELESGSSVCTTAAVNIRSSPSTDSSIFFTTLQGEQLRVRSSDVLEGNGYRWIPVSGRGYDGYAAQHLLTACPDTAAGAAPCYSDTSSPRDKIVKAAWALYNQRANEHYTQDGRRWSGIANNVCPPSAPVYSDCSSAATWAYWVVFGKGKDFLNGAKWTGGYTGTLTSFGRVVPLSAAKPGDLVFYGTSSGSISHVSIFIGDGMTISHGSDPVGHYKIDSYGSLKRQQIRNYLD